MLEPPIHQLPADDPGVVSSPASLTAAPPENPQGSYRMLVNGQSFAGFRTCWMARDNHDAVLGWIVINPTLESVTEAKITTANYDAEFGRRQRGCGQRADQVGHQPDARSRPSNFSATIIMQARKPFTQSRPMSDSRGRLIPLTQWNQFGGSAGGRSSRTSYSTSATIRERGAIRAAARCCACRRPPSAPGDLSATGYPIYDPASGPLRPVWHALSGRRHPR